MDSKVAGEKRMLQLSELDEFHNEAYAVRVRKAPIVQLFFPL